MNFNNIGNQLGNLKIENTDTSRFLRCIKEVFDNVPEMKNLKIATLLPHQFNITALTITLNLGDPIAARPYYIQKDKITNVLKRNGFTQKLVIR